MAEIDDLNVKIGASCDLELSHTLQKTNRSIMGYMHTHGEYGADEIIAANKQLDEICAPLADALDGYGPPKGWYDYDNNIFAACTQARKVELIFWDHYFEADDKNWDTIFPAPQNEDGNSESPLDFIAHEAITKYYNRLSKFLYMAAVFDSLEEQKFLKLQTEED